MAIGSASSTHKIPIKETDANAHSMISVGLIPSVLDIIAGIRILFSVRWMIQKSIAMISAHHRP